MISGLFQLIIQILQNTFCTFMKNNYPFMSISCKPSQLICCGMYKVISWLNYYNTNYSTIIFAISQLWTGEMSVKWIPGGLSQAGLGHAEDFPERMRLTVGVYCENRTVVMNNSIIPSRILMIMLQHVPVSLKVSKYLQLPLHDLTLTAQMCYHINFIMWGGITYPFTNWMVQALKFGNG